MSKSDTALSDPTSFVAAAEAYRLDGLHQDALVTLIKGLSENPSHDQARLLLARVFVELGCVPYALNELRQLVRRFPANASLQKLFRALGGSEVSVEKGSAASVVAESEIDFDAIDELERE
jgi:tetratricopeptide (TPR) repeat protein